MPISSSDKAQTAIINFYTTALAEEKIPVIKSSRHGKHLRLNYAGDYETVLNKILPCTIIKSNVSLSGTYETKELVIKKDITNASSGDSIYLVIAVSAKGLLKTKQLTPEKLGLAGKTIKKQNFLNTVISEIDKQDIPENIQLFLKDLMLLSGNRHTNITSNQIESITLTDLNIISKDFGEICGAYWFMSIFNKKVDSITFPSVSNIALIDYYANIGKNKIAVSAKSNEGAPPSINSIAEILKTMKYTDIHKEHARQAIIAISDKSVVDGIVEAAKDINTSGYVWLKKNLFKNQDFTAANCETVLSKYKTPEELLLALQPFYSIIKRSASIPIAKRIFDTKAKRYGLIISPLGYSLVDEINKDPIFVEVLNDATKAIIVSQLYMKINVRDRKVDYIVKEFTTGKFNFMYNANAGQPSLKKISFKMVKDPSKNVTKTIG